LKSPGKHKAKAPKPAEADSDADEKENEEDEWDEEDEEDEEDGEDEEDEEDEADEGDEGDWGDEEDADEQNGWGDKKSKKRKRSSDEDSEASSDDSDNEMTSFSDALLHARTWWSLSASVVSKPASKLLFTKALRKGARLLFKFNGAGGEPGCGWCFGTIRSVKGVKRRGTAFNCEVTYPQRQAHNLQLQKYLVGQDGDGKAKLSSFVLLQQ
jgi:hypothetical protein